MDIAAQEDIAPKGIAKFVRNKLFKRKMDAQTRSYIAYEYDPRICGKGVKQNAASPSR